MPGPLELRPGHLHEVVGDQSLQLRMLRHCLRDRVIPWREMRDDRPPRLGFFHQSQCLLSGLVLLFFCVLLEPVLESGLRDEELYVPRIVFHVCAHSRVCRVEQSSVLLAHEQAAKRLRAVVSLDGQHALELHLRGHHLVELLNVWVLWVKGRNSPLNKFLRLLVRIF